MLHWPRARAAADLVVVSIGVVPNEELAAAAGLAVANGIVVDELLLTADPVISAIGDCASFPSRHSHTNPVRLEAVQNAADHARCVADRLWASRSLRRAAVVLERAGRIAAADRRASPRLRPECVARQARGRRVFGLLLCRRQAARHRVDQPAGRPRLRPPPFAAGGITPDQAADDSFDLRAAAMARPLGAVYRLENK